MPPNSPWKPIRDESCGPDGLDLLRNEHASNIGKRKILTTRVCRIGVRRSAF